MPYREKKKNRIWNSLSKWGKRLFECKTNMEVDNRRSSSNVYTRPKLILLKGHVDNVSSRKITA